MKIDFIRHRDEDSKKREKEVCKDTGYAVQGSQHQQYMQKEKGKKSISLRNLMKIFDVKQNKMTLEVMNVFYVF